MQRGRKRKSIYERANEDQPLADIGEEGEDDLRATSDFDFPDPDVEIDDLDAVMGDTFADTEGDLAAASDVDELMPSRAEQSRPKDSSIDDGTSILPQTVLPSKC